MERMSEIRPPALEPLAIQPADTPAPHDPYAALRFRDFRLLGLGQFIAVLGEQMIGVAIGWELYERTRSALVLGLVGLVQVIPVILLSLPAGHIADRFDRKRIAIATRLMLALCSGGLALLSATQGSLALIYGCLLLIGAARAFNDPASASLLAQTVPQEVFTNAATWESSTWQLAAVIGPALGGLVIAIQRSATLVYVLNAGAAIICVLLLLAIRGRRAAQPPHEEATLTSLAVGVRFVWRSKILLAAITLDLFAVLLGGATALLPIFARDILQVGPTGLGWLRAAPSIGAVLMAIALVYLPPFRRAGATLLLAVAGFGAATIVFGLSRSFVLSLAMLGLLGALDNISVVIRSTLLLTQTPDSMRGRVSAVNSVFIGASNQLGGFESGLAAALFGPIIAVVGGGIGTILVVAAVGLIWPEMRRLGRLGE
jgi:MFS family permease